MQFWSSIGGRFPVFRGKFHGFSYLHRNMQMNYAICICIFMKFLKVQVLSETRKTMNTLMFVYKLKWKKSWTWRKINSCLPEPAQMPEPYLLVPKI